MRNARESESVTQVQPTNDVYVLARCAILFTWTTVVPIKLLEPIIIEVEVVRDDFYKWWPPRAYVSSKCAFCVVEFQLEGNVVDLVETNFLFA